MDVFGVINDNAALLIALVIASSVVVMFLSLAWEKLFGGYEPRVYLYTKAEHNFYRQLINRLPKGYVVNGKVRLADICEPKNKRNIKLMHKVQAKHVDFVITDFSGKIVCAIELDDNSHNLPSVMKRDAEKTRALNSAGVELIRVRCTKRYPASVFDTIALHCSKGTVSDEA